MKKLWRLSHLWLAIISFGFIFMAGVTGAILALEPMIESAKLPPKEYALEDIKADEVILLLRDNYDEVFDLKVNKDGQIIVNLLNFEPELDGEYILNPISGELSAWETKQRNPIFEWSQTLHRSLFLETTGRNVMAIMALLLTFITISGIGIIVQRQQGWRNFYRKIVSSHFSQFSHVWLGRIFLFPLLIITLSAIVISVERLGWMVSEDTNVESHEYVENATKDIKEFDALKQKTLADINQIEFPFSSEPEDYYKIHFKNEIVEIAQSSGQILSRQKLQTIEQLKPWAMLFHTGVGSWEWAIILFFSALSVVYFVISGGIIFWKRTFKKSIKNAYTTQEAEYIILFGSENGSTKDKAYALYHALIENGEKAYIADLNHITAFPSMVQLVVVTSTYGDGEAPFNARNFLQKANVHLSHQDFKFSVLGFGAKEYPKFCQFAKACQQMLSETSATEFLKPVYINHQNKNDFKNWWNIWSQKNGLSLKFETYFKIDKPVTHSFELIRKTDNDDGFEVTFNLWLKPLHAISFESGDLLAVYSPDVDQERFYSLSNIDGMLFISVKLHRKGLCSNYLYQMQPGETLKAYIKQQPAFHYNPQASSHTYIANGTGVGPFLGMIKNNLSKKQQLIVGLRNSTTYELYRDLLDSLAPIEVDFCYSRETEEKIYVQHVVKEQIDSIIQNLKNGGEVLICGNLSMGKDVLDTLNQALNKENLNIDSFIENHQIKMDCY